MAVTFILCCALAGSVLLLRERMRSGIESLAFTIDTSSSFSEALLKAVPDDKTALAGREKLMNEEYTLYPVTRFINGVFSDGVLFFIAAPATAAAALAIAIVIMERKSRIKRQAELSLRVRKALRGETVFKAAGEDERIIEQLFGEIKRLDALREESASSMRLYVENAAHEIKSPTSGIMLNIDLIEVSGVTETRLNALRKCAARIENYTSGLLSLARLRAGKVRLSFERTNTLELLKNTETELLPNGIAVEIKGGGADINADRLRLTEAVRNLIINASKHSEEKTPVVVELTDTEYDATIRVLDKGPGIRDENMTERFRLGTEDGSSHGIGLSLAQEVAKIHSGKLIFRPSENCSSVEICIPRYRLKTAMPL